MENQSLTIALTLVTAICSMALFINWAGNKHIPGLLEIAYGFALTSVGVLMLTLQGALYGSWITIMFANGMILFGRIPLLIGLAAFWSQEDSKLPMIAGALFVVTMIAYYYFTFPADNEIWRIRLYTGLMVFFELSFIYILTNGLKAEKKLRPVVTVSANFGAFLALMLFVFNAVTELVLMFVRTSSTIAATDDGTSILLLGSIFTMIVLSFAIIIMTMEELNIEHKENAIYDPITTILNHRTFLEVGNRVMGIALRYSKPVTLLTIEIENMDEVVKTYGYKIGNEMLRHFSLMATDRRRNEDVLARSSFKEFRMLLPGVDEEGCKVVIEKVDRALKAEQFIIQEELMEIKVNVSAITKREEDLDLQQMLQEGEVELYRIKMAKQTLSAD